MRSRRGSILAQVLITAAVASLLCATILRARLQPALTTANAVSRVQDDLAAQAAVNRVTEVWTRQGVCSTDLDGGVRCGGSGCDCKCALTPALSGAPLTLVTSVSASVGGGCVLTAARQ